MVLLQFCRGRVNMVKNYHEKGCIHLIICTMKDIYNINNCPTIKSSRKGTFLDSLYLNSGFHFFLKVKRDDLHGTHGFQG